jgi:4-amino-4-deoxychorismate lyase
MTEASMIIVNSQPQDSLPATDRGLAYGDGVFETMKVKNGDIALWHYHYARLLNGLQRLHIDINHHALFQHIQASIASIASAHQRQQASPQEQGVLKLIVTRGDGQRGYMPSADASATLISIYRPLSDTYLHDNAIHQQKGVAVHLCHERLAVSSSRAGIKSLNQLPYVLASRERQVLALQEQAIQKKTLQEGLMLDKDGYIIEATARNFFLVKDNVLYTPLVDQCGVAGVMRRLVIEVSATQAGIAVKEARITQSMLEDADEIFLSNSVSGIWPVVSCVGRINSTNCVDQQWPVGAISQKIHHNCHHFQVDKNQTLAAYLSSSATFSSSPL